MGFREAFLGAKVIKTNNFEALSSFGTQSSIIGWRADQASFEKLQKLLQKAFLQIRDRLVHSQISAISRIQRELVQEEIELSYLIEKITETPSQEKLANKIQDFTDYLGLEFSQIRWVMEPYTTNSQKPFQALLDSLSDISSQHFREAIKCFELGEYSFAKQQFNTVLTSNRTNYFAYQYLGFIGVMEDDSEAALVNFKLARKFADTDYHQALSLSHLAIGCYALGELEKGVKLAEQATEMYPQLARFWYQLAKYQLALQNKEAAINALVKAIYSDWAFWGVTIIDSHFEELRLDIYQLFSKLREQQQHLTQETINNLKKAIDTAKQMGVTYNLSKPTAAYAKLELSWRSSHIFQQMDLVSEAKQLQENIFQIAEKHLKDLISSKRSSLTQQETNKDREIKELDNSITRLTQEKKELPLLHRNWNLGCGGYCLLNFVSLALLIVFIMAFYPNYIFFENHPNPFAIGITVISSTVVAIFIPITFNYVTYTKKVTSRSKEIDKEIQQRKRDARQQKTKIEEEYKTAKSKLEKELKELENMFEICHNKHYL